MPVPGNAAEPERARIIVSNVSHRFSRSGANKLVLSDVNLSIGEGEFVALVGASGCGKTTLLRAMAGLITPRSGTVELGGGGEQCDVAMVFQSDTLLPWRTVAQNISIGCEIQRKPIPSSEIMRLLELVGLSGYGDHWPRELSGGMRQRVNLARALATDPQALLMDEPFAALDAQTREIMQQELLSIWGQTGKSVVFVTHQIDEALFLADRVVVLAPNPGRVVKEIPVKWERPRDISIKTTAAFMDAVEVVGGLIRGDAVAAAHT